MNLKSALIALLAISIVGYCSSSECQTSSGTPAVAPQAQPPATQPPTTQPPAAQVSNPDSIVPDNPIILIPKNSSEPKPKIDKGKTYNQGGVLLPMTISYRPWKGLIAVDGLANGNNPARFIISSGLNMSTVSPEDAIRLQLTTSAVKTHVAVLDASTDVPTATILKLRLGTGTLHDINVAQVNLITLLTHDPTPDAPTCWLGTNWLSDYQVTLNFDNHTIVLNGKKAPFSKPTGTIVPFKLVNGRPFIKVNVAGGGSYQAMVDTGAMGTLIPADVALKLKSKKTALKSDKKTDKNSVSTTPRVGGDIGAGRMGRMVLPKISVGKAELKNLLVAYYGAAAPAGADKTMAVIGLDFLRRFRVTFNYSKSQMELYAPEAAEAAPAAPTPSRKPGTGINSSPFSTNPFGTNQNGTNTTGANQNGTNSTGMIPH